MAGSVNHTPKPMVEDERTHDQILHQVGVRLIAVLTRLRFARPDSFALDQDGRLLVVWLQITVPAHFRFNHPTRLHGEHCHQKERILSGLGARRGQNEPLTRRLNPPVE